MEALRSRPAVRAGRGPPPLTLPRWLHRAV